MRVLLSLLTVYFWGCFEVSAQCLSGTYTVGGTPSDFPYLQDALDHVQYYGVCGPTIFSLRDGVHRGQFSMYQSPGTSAVNNITITSESNHPDSVTLRWVHPNGFDNRLVVLQDVSHITFDNLTFLCVEQLAWTGLVIDSASSNITVTNSKFIVEGLVYPNSPITAIRVANNHVDSIIIRNNHFIDTRAFSSDITFARIDHVEFSHNRSEGIGYHNGFFGASIHNLQVFENVFKNGNVNIYLVDQGFLLNRNKFYDNYNGAIYVNNCPNYSGQARVIKNNFIHIDGTDWEYALRGIDITNAKGVEILGNNINIVNADPDVHSCIRLNGADSTIIKNNNIVGDSLRAFDFWQNGSVYADYNNFWNNHYIYADNDFAAWQNNSLTGSQNSVMIDPQYFSDSDLHVGNILLAGLGDPTIGLIEDFDGELRSMTAPDIGADEIPDDLGVIAPSGSNAITVYPNPATGALYLSEGIDSEYETAIYDAAGKLVLLLPKKKASGTIDVSRLDNGIYLLRNGKNYGRFVIHR